MHSPFFALKHSSTWARPRRTTQTLPSPRRTRFGKFRKALFLFPGEHAEVHPRRGACARVRSCCCRLCARPRAIVRSAGAGASGDARMADEGAEQVCTCYLRDSLRLALLTPPPPSPDCSIKFYYGDMAFWRAEVCRLALHIGDVPFEVRARTWHTVSGECSSADRMDRTATRITPDAYVARLFLSTLSLSLARARARPRIHASPV